MVLLPCSNMGPFFLTSMFYHKAPLGVFALHSLFLYLDMLPLHPFGFQLAQTSFEPNLYLHNYPCSLVLVILLVHMAYEDRTECSKTLTHKIQMLGNHPKERIQHS